MQQNSIIELVQQIIYDAIRLKASDIHFEPHKTEFRIRLRVDGVLQTRRAFPLSNASAMIARLKILADLDISETRLPQDGCFQFVSTQHRQDCRLSTLATRFGEKAVVRLLSDASNLLELHELGMLDSQLAQFQQQLKQPQGLILVNGPTGSGKTSTLYAALQALNHQQQNITTIEDPIEMELPGINQVPIQPKIGFSFAAALRAILRQDPDIIMIGEIRDLETANIAIRAAQTGHLVLATCHTNDAIDSVTRLVHMGVPAYALASTLNCSLAQRLVRQLCTHAPRCHDGYCGRAGVFECLVITDPLRDAITQQQTKSKLLQQLDDSFIDLWQCASVLMKQGKTDRQEIARVMHVAKTN